VPIIKYSTVFVSTGIPSTTTSGVRSSSPPTSELTTPQPGRIRGVTNSRRNTVTRVEGEIVVVAKYLMLQYTLFVDPLPDPVTLTSAVHGVWSRAQDEIADAGNIEASEKSLDLLKYSAVRRQFEITFQFLAPQIADAIYECINETIVCLTCAILCHTLRAWRTGALLDPPEFKSEAVRDLFLQQRNTWRGFPRAIKSYAPESAETIMDKVKQENRVLKERREGFADNHEAVHRN
ncbi:hypothetical protein B9Z19DRAFT_1137381, partial [Tuber borchii]